MNDTVRRSHGNGRSAAELEREVARLGETVAQSLDEVGRRLSPERLMSQAKSAALGAPRAVAEHAGAALRRHPVLSSAAGIGVGIWIAAARALSGREKPAEVSMDVSMEAMAPPRPNLTPQRPGAEILVARRAKPAPPTGALGRFVHERPIVATALALGLGAVLAAMVPLSRREDRWFGSMRRLAGGGVEAVLRSQWDKAKRVAEAAGEAAITEAERQNLAGLRGLRGQTGDREANADGSGRHQAGDVVVYADDGVAERADRHHDEDGDQRRHQPILDGSGAALIRNQRG
jgi:hypothetical protein